MIQTWRVMTKNAYRIRSISMPSRLHPLVLRVEDQLKKLNACNTTSLSLPITHITLDMLNNFLSGLKELHKCVDDLLQPPLTHQALVRHRYDKWVDEVLDGSLSVLDVCGTARDVFMQMKEHVLDIESALRRREGRKAISRKINVYISSKREMKKEIEKCIRALKMTERKCTSSALLGGDQQLISVIHVLREVRSITTSILESLFSFMAISRPKAKMAGRSLVLKCVSARRIVCEGEAEKMSDVDRVDADLHAIYSGHCYKQVEPIFMENAQRGLEKLEKIIQCFEDELDCVFRHLIKTRVYLLNMFNL